MYPIINRPKSRGRISLKSSDPLEYPKIEPNYLSHPQDVKTLVEGLKMVRQIGDSPSFKEYGSKFYSRPFPLCSGYEAESDAYWECWVRSLATTDHHPIGTCKMGPQTDRMAVVDPSNLKVRKVHNLRVVDASVMPRLPSGNINVPIIMVAERAAHFVKRDYYYKSPSKI